MSIRLLGEPELDDLINHLSRHIMESGRHGAPIFSPQPARMLSEPERLRARRRVGWLRSTDEVGWERTWGYVDQGRVVGHVELHGGRLQSELHRAMLGIGIERAYRGRGVGRSLLEAAIGWARAQRDLAWIDLGVFADNRPARQLYQQAGFREVGRVVDRFRVEGVSIEDIRMTLSVAA